MTAPPLWSDSVVHLVWMGYLEPADAKPEHICIHRHASKCQCPPLAAPTSFKVHAAHVDIGPRVLA